ncbi:MAG: tRNA cytidylyltransferase [Myxococcota bacterium]|jgi:tRNA nucleotidyltransferase (CCA-adding enzyme)|nr:tRNA cytidylyltransferase [Myxococcota bacterium]
MSDCSAISDRIPKAALQLLRVLEQAKERGWIVGGAVRDGLLGRKDEPDWDIATTATPQRVMELFRKVVPTGLAHGTVTVLLDGRAFEVTTLRGESVYSDGRHPDQVRFIGAIEADLERRDFTVNAIAFDPLRRELCDPFGGAEDLRNRTLRAVGDPLRRFSEDGLRLLRAARFCAVLEMNIEPLTESAMAAMAHALDKVSAERKRDELRKMLAAKQPSRGLEVLFKTSLWSRVFRDHPRLATPPSSPEALLRRVDAVENHETLRLASLLTAFPLATAAQGESEAAKRWLTKMRFERGVVSSVADLVAVLGIALPCPDDSIAVRGFAVSVGPANLEGALAVQGAILRADGKSEESLEALRRAVGREMAGGLPMTIAQLAVSGGDLRKELGMEPGPRMGELLRELHAAVVQGTVRNERAALLTLCRTLIAP